MPDIVVLRLFHRKERDKRITTHCALVARAFGGIGMYYTGDKDENLTNIIDKINKNWGGKFFLKYVEDPEEVIKSWREKGKKAVQLTMYGINLPDVEKKLRRLCKRTDLMLIVGSSKVPTKFYRLVDMNVAVGHQPHSEVAALAIVMDRIFKGMELRKKFEGAKIMIEPQMYSKKVVVKS